MAAQVTGAWRVLGCGGSGQKGAAQLGVRERIGDRHLGAEEVRG